MKFTQNTSIMNPNTINAQYRAVTDSMAYGTAGKDYEAMAGAVGQVVKFAQQKQDEHDASDLMQARNEIMGNITNQMYGEKGLMTLGVGENAQGLQDRVTKTIQDTFDKISKKYNPRVRKALKGNLNENMANYQRLAGQQEGREYVKMQDVNYSSGQAMNLDRAVAGYQDDTTLGVTIDDSLRMLHGYGALKGWSGAQMQAEERNLFSTIGGSAIQAAMDNNDLTRADILNQRYGPYMDQTTRMKFGVALKKNADIEMSRNMGKTLLDKFGEDEQAAHDYLFNVLAKETETVSSGGSSGVDAVMAAIGGQESGGNYVAQNSRTKAYGKYQIMPDNWPSWSKEAGLGDNAPQTPENQEKVARFKINQYYQQYGAEGTMVAWYSGPANAQRWVEGKDTDVWGRSWDAKNGNGNEPSIREYVQQVSARGGAGSGAAVKPYQMPTQGASIDEQVGNLKDTWKHGVMDWVGGVVKDVFHYSNPTISSAARSSARNAQVSTSGDKSWHVHNDALDVVFDEGQNLSQKEKDALVKYFKDTGMFSEVLYHNYGSGWHLHLGGLKSSNPPQGGGSGYTKRKYSESLLQASYQQYKAQLSDWRQTRNFKKQQTIENYVNGAKGLSSQSDVLAYLAKVKGSGVSVAEYNAIESQVAGYYHMTREDKPKGVGRTGQGSRRTPEQQGENAADVMAATLGRGKSVSSETLVKVRNYNLLNQEEWDYLHSTEIQGKLADMIDENGGDLQATYKKLEAQYGSRRAAQILATADDEYYG